MSEQNGFTWEIDVPLLSNRWMWLDWAKVLGWTYLIMTGLMALIFAASGDAADVLPFLWIFALVVGGLALFGLLVMGLFFGNRYRMRFTVSEEGVLAQTLDRRAKFVNRLPVGGAALIAQSREEESFPWQAVATAHPYPRQNVVILRNRWRRLMILHCPSQDFPSISAYVQERLREEGVAVRSQRNPLPLRLLWTALAVLACLPLFSMPYPLELDLFLPILLVCFALATVWLSRFMGVVVLGATLYAIIITLVGGFQVRQAEFFSSLGSYTAFAWMDPGEWAQLALTLAGLLLLSFLSIQALRGRLPSMLEQDASGE
ncbi:MAG: hypothetical protein NTV14_03390 [Coprothermobacterota bacterium]|nr:hypothetical protein [Coprothermobacterota bacterium]